MKTPASRFSSLLLLASSLLCCGTSVPGDASVGGDGAAGADAVDAAPEASSDDGGALDASLRNVTAAAPAASRVLNGGVRRESFFVRAPSPAPNPGGAGTGRGPTPTPAELDRVRVLRYRSDRETPEAVRAVFVAMPGFLGGAGSFDGLARALVARGVAQGAPVEVWAVDRRANLLEDLRGMDAADVLGDPELAREYYLSRSVTVNGARFEGFVDPRAATNAYMSEWGLATTVNDLRAVITQVPDAAQHVVLLGHSLGASIVEAYAAWDFAGEPGYRSLAGLALVDGVLSGAPLTEAEYYRGGAAAPGGFGPSMGVDALRASGPYYFALPLLGVRALVVSEIVARRALVAPDAVVRDLVRDQVFRTLLGGVAIPPMSNAAAMGFGFDAASCGLTIAAMSVGQPTGGPLGMAMGPLGGSITVPASGTETYRWIDATESAPREFTPLRVAAEAWAATPSNFSEWYFPTRIALDVGALGGLALARDGYAFREGIRAQYGGSVDVPVLAIGTELVANERAFDVVRPRLSAAVGEGRPNAGARRDDPRGFRVLMVPEMTHIDPVVAPEGATPANPIPAALVDFARDNSAMTVQLPAR